VTLDPGTRSGGRPEGPKVRRTLAVVRYAGRNLYRSQIPRMAAALAYRTLFALIPVLVVGLVVLGSFASENDVQAAVERLLRFTGISEIAVEPEQIAVDAPSGGLASFFGPMPAAGGDRPPASFSLEKRLGGLPSGAMPLPPPPTTAPAQAPAGEPEATEATEVAGFGASERLDEWITALVGRVRTIPFGAIGLVGVAILVYAALSMFVEVEKSFNQLYGAREGRPWLTRLTMYWTMLTLGTVFLLASFWVGERFQSWVIASMQGEGGNVAPVVVAGLGFFVTVCITTLLLLIIYTAVPNTKVKVQAALAGAFVAALLWEAGKWGFTQYLQYTTGYARFYGQVAILPIFMLWIYLTWLIALFGLQVSHMLQSFERWKSQLGAPESRESEEDESRPAGEPWSPVLVAAAVARGFERGEAVDASAVAGMTGLGERQAERCLSWLADRGVLREVADADGAFVPAKPASGVPAEALIDPGHEPEDGCPGSAAVARVRSAVREALAGRTLADLLEGDGPPSGSEGAEETSDAPPRPARPDAAGASA